MDSPSFFIPGYRPETVPAVTVSEVFAETVKKHGASLAFRQTVAKEPPIDGSLDFSDNFEQISYTWERYNQNARAFAKALIGIGVKREGAVTIQGSNSAQWLFANVGTILAGGVAAGIYATNNSEMSQHAVLNSGAQVVVVEDEKQLEKYVNLHPESVKCFVVWNKIRDEQLKKKSFAPVYEWDEFIQRGEDIEEAKLDRRIAKQNPNKVCSLVYTSGTTSLPKAAALSHDNLIWTVSRAGEKFSLTDTDSGLSYLPLSHIAAQQIDCIGALVFGYKMDIAPPSALKGNNLKQHLIQARPSCFLGVPRVWEKFKEGIEEKLCDAPEYKKIIFNIATAVTHWTKSSSECAPISWIKNFVDQTIGAIFRSVIITPIKAAMGLDRCRIAASGAAPLDPKVSNFFAGLNIQIIDLFGLSETSGPSAIGDVLDHPEGSCGKALPGTQIIITDPDAQGEGEISLRGRHIFKGYWGNDKATEEVFDNEGFFRTGDLGRLDANGNLFITGRLKELLKTSGGENIPPVRIEQKLQMELPIVSQSVVIGDKKNYLTCLLTLKTELESPEKLAQSVINELEKLGSKAKTPQEAAQDPVVQEYLKKGIERANKQADSQAQSVQKFRVITEEFSPANGLMTATLKLRRSEILKRHNDVIEEMYA